MYEGAVFGYIGYCPVPNRIRKPGTFSRRSATVGPTHRSSPLTTPAGSDCGSGRDPGWTCAIASARALVGGGDRGCGGTGERGRTWAGNEGRRLLSIIAPPAVRSGLQPGSSSGTTSSSPSGCGDWFAGWTAQVTLIARGATARGCLLQNLAGAVRPHASGAEGCGSSEGVGDSNVPRRSTRGPQSALPAPRHAETLAS